MKSFLAAAVLLVASCATLAMPGVSRADCTPSPGSFDCDLAARIASADAYLAARPGVLTAEELAGAVNGDVGRFSPYAVYLPSGDPAQIPAVRDGQALVQDEGSQLVARALTLAPLADDHGRWLDLCAGPGGKTALLAALAAGSGARVTAVEPAEHRADLVVQNTSGLSVDVLRVDGRSSGLEPGFDRVLVDALTFAPIPVTQSLVSSS